MTPDGHPVVFASKGSHGFWTRQGIHVYKVLFNKEKLVDLTSAGLNWDTWRNMRLIKYRKNTKRNPYTGRLTWLNYNGDWGNSKQGCIRVKVKFNLFNKWRFNRVEEQCTLTGGPGSLLSRGSMTKHFPLN